MKVQNAKPTNDRQPPVRKLKFEGNRRTEVSRPPESCKSCSGSGQCTNCKGSGSTRAGFAFFATTKPCGRCAGHGVCSACGGSGLA
jgi:DnaJ-class molecular chaperone